MSRDELRAADADRQAVADQLRVALEEGRLDLDEYDERLQLAYAAKTYGDLAPLLKDLPSVHPAAGTPADRPVVERVTARWLVDVWSGWVPAVAITTTIWLVASIAAGRLVDFWPIWWVGPWGVLLLWQTISGLATGRPRKAADERARRELARQRKRERKAIEADAIARGERPPGEPPPGEPVRAGDWQDKK